MGRYDPTENWAWLKIDGIFIRRTDITATLSPLGDQPLGRSPILPTESEHPSAEDSTPGGD